MKEFEQWDGFEGRLWKEEVNVRDFIQNNYTQYEGDEEFLAGPTEATNRLWGKLQELQKAERAKNGVLDMETEVVTSLTAYIIVSDYLYSLIDSSVHEIRCRTLIFCFVLIDS